MNREEASMFTEIQVRPDTKDVKFSEEIIHTDIKEMLRVLKKMGANFTKTSPGDKAKSPKNRASCGLTIQ